MTHLSHTGSPTVLLVPTNALVALNRVRRRSLPTSRLPRTNPRRGSYIPSDRPTNRELCRMATRIKTATRPLQRIARFPAKRIDQGYLPCPDREDPRVISYSFLRLGAFNILKEFWPDINRIIGPAPVGSEHQEGCPAKANSSKATWVLRCANVFAFLCRPPRRLTVSSSDR